MKINFEGLRGSERALFALKGLYEGYGYTQYKMSKFEEYELYVRNKSFLVSDHVITFTDAGGSLMALKPDVTLSIVKNSPESEKGIRKVYYNENVYRVPKGALSFKEIMQAGLECIGDIGDAEISEVISLAAKSLDLISESNVLEISNLDIVSGVLDEYGLMGEARAEILKLLGEKNYFGVNEVCEREGLSAAAKEIVGKLVTLYGTPELIVNELSVFAVNDTVKCEIERFIRLLSSLSDKGISDKICIDFSVMNDMKYYNGFAFRGFVEGIPTGILSGGQYDRIMKKMHKKSGAIGFAVYLDELMKL